jgi:hydroxyethylthiazole kinase-like uncharacterized protein yjeF
MLEVVSVSEMLRLEEEVKLPEHTLMRTAAFGLYIEILDILRVNFGSASGLKVLGLIGLGNNGSDALWSMSLLGSHGLNVVAVDTTKKRTRSYADSLFEANAGRWSDFDEISDNFDVIIDGVAGLRNQYAPSKEILDLISQNPEALLVSVDMPSCFDNDAAVAIDSDSIIYADYTITFGYLKPCHIFDPARSFCGEVRVVELPLLKPQSKVAQLVEPSDVMDLLHPLDSIDHKYSHGVLGVISGSDQYLGAGELALLGSQWIGTGYIQFLGPELSDLTPNVVRVTSLEMFHQKTNTIVFGPGVGVTGENEEILKTLLQSPLTLILDADAITLLAQNPKLLKLQQQRSAMSIFTPHHGEALRLADALQINTTPSAHILVSDISRQLNAVVSYKNAHGFISFPDGSFMVCNTTSHALATAGTGDVLAGLMGSLIAQNNPRNFSDLGLCAMGAIIIHSIAADLALEHNLYPTAVDIAHQIPAATTLLKDIYE